MTTSPQIPFNLIPTDPHLTDALNLLKRDVMLNLSAHHVATIQSFNAALQTCTATINYPKTYFVLNPATRLYTAQLETYPILVDCPVIALGGGKGALTMPIQKGDECLVLFNDRDLDNWFQGGAGAAVATPRTHSFSDGIVLVGLRSLGNVLANYDLVRATLRGGSGVVGVNTSSNKVLIANVTPTGSGGSYTYSTTLNTLLQNLATELGTLITNIKSLVTATAAITVSGVTTGSGASGVPVNAATITAVNTQLTTVASQISTTATQIAGLLE